MEPIEQHILSINSIDSSVNWLQMKVHLYLCTTDILSSLSSLINTFTTSLTFKCLDVKHVEQMSVEEVEDVLSDKHLY